MFHEIQRKIMSSQPVPFSYTVRISPRAKYVRLTIDRHRGLEVVVPKGFDHHRIPDILADKEKWIIHHLGRLKRSLPELSSHVLPESIAFNGISEYWKVRYVPVEEATYTINETPNHGLDLCGPDNHVPTMTSLLNKWLILQGKKHLPGWAVSLAEQYDFPRISRIQIRNQKTRWGSCSARGTISLNAKLLFISPELVKYILVHELCHLVHLNHSPAFWGIVERHLPDFRIHEERLAHAGVQVPTWAGCSDL
jgi:hypothetical protein